MPQLPVRSHSLPQLTSSLAFETENLDQSLLDLRHSCQHRLLPHFCGLSSLGVQVDHFAYVFQLRKQPAQRNVQELSRVMSPLLTHDQESRYKAELEKRAASRKQVVIDNLVAKLDGDPPLRGT